MRRLAGRCFERCPGEPAEAEAAVRKLQQACAALQAGLVELRSEDWAT